MRYLLLLLLLMSFKANSDAPLCPINTEIAEDMRVRESDLTQANAKQALQRLNKIIDGEDDNYIWITVPNLQIIIEGYILKKDALNQLVKKPDFDVKSSEFCLFMKRASWYD